MAIALLSIMAAVAPLEWNRVEIDAATGESIARCDGDYFGAFIWPLAFIMFVPTVLTGFMAWKTLDVDASYSDAFWVGALILVQLEVRARYRPISSRHPQTLTIRTLVFYCRLAC
jgi:hypothetical protein